MAECNCFDLQRFRNIEVRNDFETMTTERLLDIAENTDELSMACFASGSLFSEFSIVAYSMMKLREGGWAGEFIVQIIDLEYAPFVQGTVDKYTKAIVDFWHYLSHSGSSEMSLKVRVFASLKGYERGGIPADCFIAVDPSSGAKIFLQEAPRLLSEEGFAATLLKVEVEPDVVRPEYRFFTNGAWETIAPTSELKELG